MGTVAVPHAPLLLLLALLLISDAVSGSTPPPDLPSAWTAPPIVAVYVDLAWSVPAAVEPEALVDGTLVVEAHLLHSAEQYVGFRSWPDSRQPEGLSVHSDTDQVRGVREAVAESGVSFGFVDSTNSSLRFSIHVPNYGPQMDEAVTVTMTKAMFKSASNRDLYIREGNQTAVTFTVQSPKERWQQATMYGAVAATAFSAGPAALQAQTVGFLAMMECGAYRTDDPRNADHRLFHVTQASINGRTCAGAVVANVSLAAGALLLLLLCAAVALRYKSGALMRDGTPRTFSAAQATVWCPSLAVVAFAWVFQGTASCAMALVARPGGSAGGNIAIGVAGLVVLAGAVGAIHLAVVPDARKLCRYELEPAGAAGEGRGASLRTFLIGPGEWINVDPNVRHADRCASVLRPWAASYAAFFSFDFVAALAFAVVGVVRPQTFLGCGYLRVGIGAVSAAMAALLWTLRPYVRSRDNYAQVARLCAQSIGFALLGAAYFRRAPKTDPLSYAGSLLVFASIAILCLTAVADCVGELYVWRTGRRDTLQCLADERAEERRRRRWDDDAEDEAKKAAADEAAAAAALRGGKPPLPPPAAQAPTWDAMQEDLAEVDVDDADEGDDDDVGAESFYSSDPSESLACELTRLQQGSSLAATTRVGVYGGGGGGGGSVSPGPVSPTSSVRGRLSQTNPLLRTSTSSLSLSPLSLSSMPPQRRRGSGVPVRRTAKPPPPPPPPPLLPAATTASASASRRESASTLMGSTIVVVGVAPAAAADADTATAEATSPSGSAAAASNRPRFVPLSPAGSRPCTVSV